VTPKKWTARLPSQQNSFFGDIAHISVIKMSQKATVYKENDLFKTNYLLTLPSLVSDA